MPPNLGVQTQRPVSSNSARRTDGPNRSKPCSAIHSLSK
ncbi:hypothetical protein HNP40_003686 [Mycobacteroides chelonae]|nr:hypothetical protein [Mycobacteroides chelonae]